MCGKGTAFKFSGPYSEIWPAKLNNQTAHTERYNKLAKDVIFA